MAEQREREWVPEHAVDVGPDLVVVRLQQRWGSSTASFEFKV